MVNNFFLNRDRKRRKNTKMPKNEYISLTLKKKKEQNKIKI